MLTVTSRWLTYFTAILYAVLGAFLFFLPEQLAPVFAWKVTAFMTMTIGAWCLGNAWLAWISARRWEWRLVYSALIYLWLFGIFESGVVIAFRAKLQLVHPIAWLYLAALTVNVLTALLGFFDWLRLRPAREKFGLQFGNAQLPYIVAFIVFVGFLALYGLFAPVGAPGTNGGIFPEVMSPFTLRSFAVFYLALAIAVGVFLWDRNLDAILHHSLASYGLVVIITLAAFAYLRLFDFAARPGGLLYFGAYLAVGIPLFFVFRKHGTGKAEKVP
ncbi:hypothetical protein [Candidatus Villigracilis affinis]|uniref:hypothetical protein n=1 Tax=Candidatus Villigracilis affinis TaxID=3140682 RepID=UPI001D46931B|nr:hypothetical protein [Anaerolineales bacterium]